MAVPRDAILVVEFVRVVLNRFFGAQDPKALDLLGSKNLILNPFAGNLDDKGSSFKKRRRQGV